MLSALPSSNGDDVFLKLFAFLVLDPVAAAAHGIVRELLLKKGTGDTCRQLAHQICVAMLA